MVNRVEWSADPGNTTTTGSDAGLSRFEWDGTEDELPARSDTWRTTAVILLALLLISLAGCVDMQEQYVEADRLTYEVVAPYHRAYVEGDPSLSPEQVERRLLLLDSWADRITEAEAALGE